MSTVHQRSEILHSAVGVWILEQHTAHILPTEVHLMRQLQHCLHPDVAVSQQSQSRAPNSEDAAFGTQF